MHRKYQDWQLRKLRADVLDQLNPVGAGQTEIDNRQLGAQFANHIHRFRGVACLAADCKTVVGLNQFLETFSKQRVIIDNDYPFRVRRIAFRILIGRPHNILSSCGWFGWRCRTASHQFLWFSFRDSSLGRLSDVGSLD